MRLPREALPPAWLVLLLLALAFGFQGSRGIWEPDEGRYATVALNMLDDGDWLVPHLHREYPHLAKPPLSYWAIAASVAVFGRNEWAIRAPMALAFVLTGLLAYALGRRLVPVRPELPAAIWASSLLPFAVANIASTDMLLTAFETLAMYGFVAAWATPTGEPRRGWIRLMWLGFGLAFLTKGPPGLLPLLAAAGYCACHDRRLLREFLDPTGLLLFALTAFTWFALLIAQDPDRLRYLLGYEVVDRVFSARHHRNAEWYAVLTIYAPTLLLGALPWWPFAVAAAGGPRSVLAGLRARLRDGARGWRLLAWWLLLPLAVFCVARSRLPTYLLPLFVPLAILIARPLARRAWLGTRRFGAFVALSAVALLSLKAVAAQRLHDRDARSIAAQIAEAVDLAGIDEIVFVGMPPQYGLRLYLGKAIEGIQIDRALYPYARVLSEQDVCEELREQERNVYVVKRHHEQGFLRAAGDCGPFRLERLGEYYADGHPIAMYRVAQ